MLWSKTHFILTFPLSILVCELICIGELNPGGNRAVDWQSLHVTETGISSDLVGLLGPYIGFIFLKLPRSTIIQKNYL